MDFRKIFCLAVCIGVTEITSAQLIDKMIIKGRILNVANQRPIPYTNIGLVGMTIGTMADSDGTFMLDITRSPTMGGTLKISALGFRDTTISLNRVLNRNWVVIQIKERITPLDDVTIQGKVEKGFRFGNPFSQAGVNLCSIDGSEAGSAMALLIENRGSQSKKKFEFPTAIKSAELRIANNSLPAFRIRVRVYDRDPSTGLPSRDLLNESVIVTSIARSGWIKFDLKPYKIKVHGPFFIAFEWISDSQERAEIAAHYRQFEKENPEKISVVPRKLSGTTVDQTNYHEFLEGTSFGVSALPISLRNFVSYSRTGSFGAWTQTPYVLAAKVTLN